MRHKKYTCEEFSYPSQFNVIGNKGVEVKLGQVMCDIDVFILQYQHAKHVCGHNLLSPVSINNTKINYQTDKF